MSSRAAPPLVLLGLMLAAGAHAQAPGDEESLEEPGSEGTLADDFNAVWPERDAQVPLNGVVYVDVRWPELRASVAVAETSVSVTPRLLNPGCGFSCVYEVPLPRELTEKAEPIAVRLEAEREETQRTYRPGPFEDRTPPRVGPEPRVVARRTVVRDILGTVRADSVTLEVTLLPGADDDGEVGAYLLYTSLPGEEPAFHDARVLSPACPLCSFVVQDVPVSGDGQTCLSVAALDGAGNESPRSNPVCVDVPEEELGFGCQGAGAGTHAAPWGLGLLLFAIRRR